MTSTFIKLPGEFQVKSQLIGRIRSRQSRTAHYRGPIKFLTLADWTGMVETELFAQTYRSYGLATVRYPVLEVAAAVEPFDNGRGFSLRVSRQLKKIDMIPVKCGGGGGS